MVAWYQKHLGLKTDDYACTFWWKDKDKNDCSSQWSPFADDITYFAPSEKRIIQNFRVDYLEKLFKKLSDEGVTIVGDVKTYGYGKFGWILDSERNKIELRKPINNVFQ